MGRLVLIALVGAGCYRVDPVECAITCAGGVCPSGLSCLDDGFCHASGSLELCESDDAGSADARPDAGLDAPGCSTKMVEVTTGWKHTCALADDGAMWCWGGNEFGQFGDGTNTPSNVPLRVQADWPPAVHIVGGQYHTCVISQTGRVNCAGNNQAGQFGNDTTDASGTPVEAIGLANMEQIAAGGYSTCARAGGQLWCWGDNNDGQLGDGTKLQRHIPVRVLNIDNGTDLTSGFRNACSVRAGGSVYCWGMGWLGNGAPLPGQSSTPVQVASSGYASVAAGLDAACGVKTADGAVFCWGYNADGQCGPAADTVTPADTGVRAAAGVAMGPYHSCARLVDGSVTCWGQNEKGQLGNGTISDTPVPTPVPVTGLSDVIDLELGEDYGCAVRRDGAVLCWGGNDLGQLGDGTADLRTIPVQIGFTCPG